MASTTLKVLFLSVNLMEKAPDDTSISAFCTAANVGGHDIVCVAEQETATKSDSVYIAQRIAAAKPGGKKWFFGDPEKKGDANAARTDVGKSRKTATATFGSRKLTCGVAWNEKVNAIQDLHFDREVVKGFRKKVIAYTAKGGAVVYMDLGNRRLGFASCHLNDESREKRDKESKDVFGNMVQNECDLIMIGGDMNYRPVYSGANPSGDDTLKAIQANYQTFYNANDLFKKKEVAFTKECAMTFPDPTFLPSYKRNPNTAKTMSPTSMNPGTALANLEKFYDLPKAKDGKVMGGEVKEARAKQKEYAIGWLDRIGYKKVTGKITSLTENDFTSFPTLFPGDHVPVMLSLTIALDPTAN